jgi:uncharacterized protein
MKTDESTSPVAHSSERIAVVDVLRAFALLGIIVTHSVTGFLAGAAPDPDFMIFGPLDRAVVELERLFSFGKFYTIFSFLFGLSFAIQLDNAAQKGVAFAGRFAWRLVVLLAIALVHGMFFSGDVLIVYALLGLLLIPCRNLSNRTLLITSFILLLNIPGLVLGLLQVSGPPPTPEEVQARAVLIKQFAEAAQHQYDIKQSGTVQELIGLNLTSAMAGKLFFLIFTGRLWITFGLFLLGLYAGRMSVFKDTAANRQRFTRLLAWGGGIAAVTTVVAIVHPTTFELKSLVDALAAFSFSVQQASLSAFYVASIVLLYWRKPAQGVLPALAPLGKLGLTTYLMQSAFGLIVFYGFGFGLLGHLGAAASVGISVAFYLLQILFARWWLGHFNLGPAEWLWRSLTYFRLHPNVRGQTSAA